MRLFPRSRSSTRARPAGAADQIAAAQALTSVPLKKIRSGRFSLGKKTRQAADRHATKQEKEAAASAAVASIEEEVPFPESSVAVPEPPSAPSKSTRKVSLRRRRSKTRNRDIPPPPPSRPPPDTSAAKPSAAKPSAAKPSAAKPSAAKPSPKLFPPKPWRYIPLRERLHNRTDDVDFDAPVKSREEVTIEIHPHPPIMTTIARSIDDGPPGLGPAAFVRRFCCGGAARRDIALEVGSDDGFVIGNDEAGDTERRNTQEDTAGYEGKIWSMIGTWLDRDACLFSNNGEEVARSVTGTSESGGRDADENDAGVPTSSSWSPETAMGGDGDDRSMDTKQGEAIVAAAEAARQARGVAEKKIEGDIDRLKEMEERMESENVIDSDLHNEVKRLRVDIEEAKAKQKAVDDANALLNEQAQKVREEAERKMSAQTEKMKKMEAKWKSESEKNTDLLAQIADLKSSRWELQTQIAQLKQVMCDDRTKPSVAEEAQRVKEQAEEHLEREQRELKHALNVQAELDKAQREAEEQTKARATEMEPQEEQVEAESERNNALNAQIAQLTKAISFDRKVSQKTTDTQSDELKKMHWIVQGLKAEVQQKKDSPDTTTRQLTKAVSLDGKPSQQTNDAQNDELKKMQLIIEGLKADIERERRLKEEALKGRPGNDGDEIALVESSHRDKIDQLSKEVVAAEREYSEKLSVVQSMTTESESHNDPRPSYEASSSSARGGQVKVFGWFRNFVMSSATEDDESSCNDATWSKSLDSAVVDTDSTGSDSDAEAANPDDLDWFGTMGRGIAMGRSRTVR